MRNTLFVPVRESKAGTLALRTGRLPSGARVGLAFTSAAGLAATMGPAQQWAELGEQALKDMLAPLGVEQVRVDPRPAGAPGADSPGGPDSPATPAPRPLAPVRIRPRPAHLGRHAA